MEKYIIISIVLSIIAIIFGLYVIINTSITDKDLTNQNNKINNQIEQLQKISSTCPGPIELPCKEGPPGIQGKSGGIFTDKGPLRNLGQPNVVADRFDDSGIYANAYLTDRTYKPQQTWTLHSSEGNYANRIENQYGGCLTIGENGEIYMTNPAGCQNATQWIFTTQGTIKPLKEKDKCLSYTNAGIFKNVEKSGLINLKGKNVNPYNNLLKLNVVDCDTKIPLAQQWSFN
jgi:hypothetical protein